MYQVNKKNIILTITGQRTWVWYQLFFKFIACMQTCPKLKAFWDHPSNNQISNLQLQTVRQLPSSSKVTEESCSCAFTSHDRLKRCPRLQLQNFSLLKTAHSLTLLKANQTENIHLKVHSRARKARELPFWKEWRCQYCRGWLELKDRPNQTCVVHRYY